MYNIYFRPSAKSDVQEIVNYYDLLNPQLSNKFLEELENTVKHIQGMPTSCQKRIGNIRVSLLKRFSYGVYFKIYDSNISVIAILHTSRNPKIWQKR